jgi:acyl-CoA hydrolase
MSQPTAHQVPTSASRVTLSRIMDALDANLHGNVHGGAIVRMVDEAAGACAARHSSGLAVTASMDDMAFLVPVRIGDLVTCFAQVNWTGRTSMEIGVKVTAERWNRAGEEPRHVASAYLVFVGVDDDEKPREIPQVAPETDEDRRRNREAGIRHEARLARRAAILQSRRAEAVVTER